MVRPLTHASIGDSFSLCDSFVPQEPECHLARNYNAFIYNLYASMIMVGGGANTHFAINVDLGCYYNHDINIVIIIALLNTF